MSKDYDDDWQRDWDHGHNHAEKRILSYPSLPFTDIDQEVEQVVQELLNNDSLRARRLNFYCTECRDTFAAFIDPILALGYEMPFLESDKDLRNKGLKKLRELTTIYVQLEKKDSKTQKKKTTMSNHERFLRALRHEKIPSASQMRSGRQNKEALVSRIQQDMKKGLKQQWPECLRCCKSKNVRCFCRTSKCANFLAHGEIGKKCDSCSN